MPVDPLVWDSARFARFRGWAWRFEACTPAAKRKLGYYALPMLWREQVIGEAEIERIRVFLTAREPAPAERTA